MLTKTMYGRVPLFDRPWFLQDVVRLAEAVNYSQRMKTAGVPDKVRRKILRRWNPFPYALHREMQGIVRDMRREIPL